MPELLLFNIGAPEKRTAIRLTALRLGLPCREIPPAMQGLTIEELLSGTPLDCPAGSTALPASEGGTPSSSLKPQFEEELLLMHDLPQDDFHELLNTLRREGQSVRLKAVVTEHNRKWTAAQLFRALQSEDEAMRRRAAQQRHPQKTKKHRKK